MNELAWFAIVWVVALVLVVGFAIYGDRRVRKRNEERMRELLTEMRDNRVNEMNHLGWGDGFDESHSEGWDEEDLASDDCDCGDSEDDDE